MLLEWMPRVLGGEFIWAVSAKAESRAKLREAAFAHMAENNNSQMPQAEDRQAAS
jgi:hypothetical protein